MNMVMVAILISLTTVSDSDWDDDIRTASRQTGLSTGRLRVCVDQQEECPTLTNLATIMDLKI